MYIASSTIIIEIHIVGCAAFGMTETLIVTTCCLEGNPEGSVGPVMPNVQAKVTNHIPHMLSLSYSHTESQQNMP